MNPRTQAVIAVAVIALLGAGVWLGRARESNNNQVNCLAAGTTDPFNANLGLPPCPETNNNSNLNKTALSSAPLPVLEIPVLGSPTDVSENAFSGERKILKWKSPDGLNILASVYEADGLSLEQFIKKYQDQRSVADYSLNEEMTVDGRRAIKFVGQADLTVVDVMFLYGPYVVSLSLQNASPAAFDANGLYDQAETKRLADIKVKDFIEVLQGLRVR
ncbi:MAG: hypothetical protein HY976_02710 [Candidatus Kerfeldbacteria bacterium]|nr:hypothetical protein [Candidatus Kerfeldbacteria bacterium]